MTSGWDDVIPNEVYFGWHIQFCTKICSVWCKNVALATLATVAHGATLIDLFYYIDFIYLRLLRIRVSLLEKVPETKLAFKSLWDALL